MSNAPIQTDNRLILLSSEDNVLVARVLISEGEELLVDGTLLRIDATLNMGHKMARREILCGDKVLKYGAPIGSATAHIRPGEHIHLHNLSSDYTQTHSLQSAAARHEKAGPGGGA